MLGGVMSIGEIRCDIDNELKFETYMRNIFKKAAQKLGVVNGISSFLDSEIKKVKSDVH